MKSTKSILFLLKSIKTEHIVLIFIIFIAFILRIWGIEYGLPYSFVGHEWGLVKLPLMGLENHNFFPETLREGHLFHNIIMVQFACIALLKFIIGFLTGTNHPFNDYLSLPMLKDSLGFYLLVVRLNCVIFGTATVYLVYLIGKKLFNNTVGLIAASLIAFLNLHIVWSHYARIDIPATFFLTLTLLIAICLYKEGIGRYYLLLGFLVGVTIAGKFPYFVFLGPLYLTVHIFHAIRHKKGISYVLFSKYFFLGLFLIPIGFFCAMPYSLIKFSDFNHAILGEFNMAKTQLAWYPRLLGFWETIWLYFTSSQNNMRSSWSFRYALGAPYEIALIVSFMFLAIRKKLKELLLIIPALLYFAYIISIGKYATRWFVPLTPIFALGIAVFLNEITKIVKLKKNQKKYLIVCLVVIILSSSLYRTIIFDYASTQKDTRIIAKEWIEKNIPTKDTIIFFWLYMNNPPVDVNKYTYKYIKIATRNSDDAIKKDRAKSLSHYRDLGIDYIVISSLLVDIYDNPEFIREFPETALSYKNFFKTLDKEAKLFYKMKPESRFTPGPTIKLYSLIK